MVTLCPRITYCCCMSVRNGCLIYGYIKLVLAVAGFILDLTMDHEDEDISKIGAIILSVFAVIINIILIVGLHKYIKLLVKIYEIIFWVLVALMVLSMVLTAVFLEWVVALSMLLLAVIFYVVNLFIRSAYLEIKERETDG
ncbi:uncharacterized protein LOC119692667 [Plutella xylostella]|uniref:uncharacterized protein LOC119692667 n=1 Tax=Plutella xylostella TaxID=51655 RepID=UPI0020321BAD|nr:uncharacterized protein LOC119692667 [Plutella xylostella]